MDEIEFGINKITVKQIDYPKAVLYEDKIDLIADSNVKCILYFNEQNLEEIKYRDDFRFAVYTLDLSEKHKEELINKLMEAKINKVNNYIDKLNSVIDKYKQAENSKDYIVGQLINTYL